LKFYLESNNSAKLEAAGLSKDELHADNLGQGLANLPWSVLDILTPSGSTGRRNYYRTKQG